MSSTMAQQIAAKFSDDGMTWTAGGKRLEEVCDEHNADWSHRDGDTSRAQFADGSALVLCRSGWDIGHPNTPGCYCWPEAYNGGHDDACEESDDGDA